MTQNNITRSVTKFIDNDSRIKFCMANKLVNVRALAGYLCQQLRFHKSQIDAVISAIRRYDPEDEEQVSYTKACAVITRSKITTKTGISIIALQKDVEVQDQIAKIFSIIYYARGETLRIIQAEESIKIIVDQHNIDKVLKLFPRTKIVKIQKNLGEINMRVEPSAYKIPGVLSIINSELSSSGINIVEAMSCVPELIWFVCSNDVIKAHSALFDMSEIMKQRT